MAQMFDLIVNQRLTIPSGVAKDLGWQREILRLPRIDPKSPPLLIVSRNLASLRFRSMDTEFVVNPTPQPFQFHDL